MKLRKSKKNGGTLLRSNIFKKIISIGFEFETQDLMKLSSIIGESHTLINSDLKIGLLENYQEDPDNFNYVRPLDNSYEEYLNEDTHDSNIKFQVTNDMSDSDFLDMLDEYCKDKHFNKVDKNNLYYFKTDNDTNYKIIFSPNIYEEPCSIISSVELIITHTDPSKYHTNTIMGTFISSCKLIINHIDSLKKMNGTLFITNDNDDFSNEFENNFKIGVIENRCLYHKPNTNLYYMDTYDSIDDDTTYNIGDVAFSPQMTFRSKATYCLSIIKEILNQEYYQDKCDKENEIMEEFIIIEKITNELIDRYNSVNIEYSINNKIIFKIKCYVFFIIYKLYKYIHYSEVINTSVDNNIMYFKNYLQLNCRHRNKKLFDRIQDIFMNHFNKIDGEKISENKAYKLAKSLFVQPDIIKNIYDTIAYDLDEEPEEHIKNAHIAVLQKTDENYGNLMYSFSSYFSKLKTSDWLFDKGIDSYSAIFNLEDDYILIEYRSFRFSLTCLFKNMFNKDIDTNITVKQMRFLLKNKDKINNVNEYSKKSTTKKRKKSSDNDSYDSHLQKK